MSVRILIGDVREQLKTMPDESVHCVVTSPPYWGLRDYGTAAWAGGDPGCDHKGDMARARPEISGCTGWGERDGRPTKSCPLCGARRIDSQLGLEPTYQEHVQTMADVFDEVRRVLRKDGTLWLNYGDSYHNVRVSTTGQSVHDGEIRDKINGGNRHKQTSLKPKDLCGMPWRVAFELQNRGWYLRQDIVWAKPNPMPESVRDRCTKAHEYIFLLSKSPKYYFDADAIRETADYGFSPTPQMFNGVGTATVAPARKIGAVQQGEGGTRNKRSVWEIATAPYSEAHFATFPPEIPTICIKAGTSEKGCCAKCGKGWVRETEENPEYRRIADGNKGWSHGGDEMMARQKSDKPSHLPWKNRTVGFSPSCQCNADVVPCTVLDPFFGAGTTGLVADRLQRNCIGIELSPAYAAMAEKRIRGDAPMFTTVAAE